MLDDDMPEDLRAIRDHCERLEASTELSAPVGKALDTMLEHGLPVTFESVTGSIGDDSVAGALFATLVVREHHRRQIAALLDRAPFETSH